MSDLNSQYGISAMVSRAMNFHGTTDKSEYPVFRNYINSKFSANGIQLVDRSEFRFGLSRQMDGLFTVTLRFKACGAN